VESLVARVADEFLERQRRGERPTAEEYATRHPEAADLLRKVLASLELVGVSTPTGEPAASRPADEPAGTLGDFRILREVGRGGMGIVYEAEQISLGRRVALKVLPFAATMDPRQLQRFHNEARAAASLHHEHIVPVYAVGQERGVHYYAMQFIDGRTLAEVIAGLRDGQPSSDSDQPTTPHARPPAAVPPAADAAPMEAPATRPGPRDAASYRRAAEWGVQAAEALEHAHALGVVHRDVKPANLMIDGQGKLWVTDFGLARFGADGGLTMTGDVLGTLRYMSPEQAMAKHGLVDHRTDVYALGATLYELLSLRPAVEGENREEVLRKIAFEEPVPPRALDRSIPEDLETITLKALAKEPGERYGTAKELADDLRRYLNHEPIRARRPSLVERAWKWAHRHKAIIGAAVATLLLAVVLLAASTVVVWGAKEEAERALSERANALQQALEQEQQATRNALEAGRQRARADDNFRQAIEEITQLVKAAQDEPRTGRTPQLEEVRKAQADRSFAFYQRLLQENRTDPAGRLQTGLVYHGLLLYFYGRGDAAKAGEAYGQAVALFKQLKDEFPAETRYHQELAKTHTLMHGFIRSLNVRQNHEIAGGHYKEAFKCRQQAVILLEALTTEQPDEPNNWFLLGVASYWLGRDLWLAGQTKEAEEHISKALPVFEKLEGDTRNGPELAWREAAFAYLWRGSLRAESGRLPEAEADYEHGLALCQKLAQAGEFWLESQRYAFASTQEALGDVLWATNRHEEAAASFRRAEEAWQELLHSREMKGFPLYNAMARFYASCPDKQFRKPAKAVELAKEAVEKGAKSDFLSPRDEGDCWKTLGVAQYRAGDWKATVAALEKAMQLRNGGDGTDWFVLAMAHWQLGDKDKARTWYAQAVRWLEKNKPQDEALRRFRAEAAELLGIKEK
jgi:serine/threonine protein kinase